MSVMAIIDRAIERDRAWARGLVVAHDEHDPDAIREIRALYRRCRASARGSAEAKRLEAIGKLRMLDEAGLDCCHCAPESACEIEMDSPAPEASS